MPNMTIRLPEAKLQRIRLAANARKKSASSIVEEAIDAFLPCCEGVSLAEALKDYIGAAGDGPPTNSSKMSEVFGDILEQKHRAGHY